MAISAKEEITLDLSKGQQIILKCEPCNTETWHVVHSSVNHKTIYPLITDEGDVYEDAEWYEGIYQIIQCQGCRKVKFRLRNTDMVDFGLAKQGGEESAYTEEIFPKHSELEPFGILLSKATFETDLRFMFREAKQNKTSLALIIGDIDNFKKINDTKGHDVGDLVLKMTMENLKQGAKGKGKVYRYGGEELTILLPNYSVQEAELLANILRERISQQTVPLSTADSLKVTMSFGIASSEHFEESTKFFQAADKAVLLAKENGRNKACVAK